MRLPCSQAVTLHLRSPPLAVTLHPWLLLTGGYPAHRQLLSQVVMLTCHRRLPYSRPVTLLTGSYPVYGWLPCSRAVTLPTVSYPALVWLLSRAVTLFTDGYLAHGWLPCSQAVTLLTDGYPTYRWLPCSRAVTLFTDGYPAHGWLPYTRVVALRRHTRGPVTPFTGSYPALTCGYPALTDGYPAHGVATLGVIAHGRYRWLPCSRVVTLHSCGYSPAVTLRQLLSVVMLTGSYPAFVHGYEAERAVCTLVGYPAQAALQPTEGLNSLLSPPSHLSPPLSPSSPFLPSLPPSPPPSYLVSSLACSHRPADGATVIPIHPIITPTHRLASPRPPRPPQLNYQNVCGEEICPTPIPSLPSL